jgi:hypothetical protein
MKVATWGTLFSDFSLYFSLLSGKTAERPVRAALGPQPLNVAFNFQRLNWGRRSEVGASGEASDLGRLDLSETPPGKTRRMQLGKLALL